MLTRRQMLIASSAAIVSACDPMNIFDIAALGTSLTEGFGTPSGYVPGGWQPHLERALTPGRSSRIRVYNFGKGGASSAIGYTDKLPFVIATKPKVCLIEFMINDALGASFPPGMSVADSAAKHVQIINAIKSGSPGTAIYLMTMNGSMPWTTPDSRKRPNLEAYNAVYPDLVSSEGVGLIDNYQLYSSVTATEIPDGIHPTEACQKSILIPSIASALSGLIA